MSEKPPILKALTTLQDTSVEYTDLVVAARSQYHSMCQYIKNIGSRTEPEPWLEIYKDVYGSVIKADPPEPVKATLIALCEIIAERDQVIDEVGKMFGIDDASKMLSSEFLQQVREWLMKRKK